MIRSNCLRACLSSAALASIVASTLLVVPSGAAAQISVGPYRFSGAAAFADAVTYSDGACGGGSGYPSGSCVTNVLGYSPSVCNANMGCEPASYGDLSFTDIPIVNNPGIDVVLFDSRFSADGYGIAAEYPAGSGTYSAYVTWTPADQVDMATVGCAGAALWSVPVDLTVFGVPPGGVVNRLRVGSVNTGSGCQADLTMAGVIDVGVVCTSAAQCNDANPCTTDACTASACVYTPSGAVGCGPPPCGNGTLDSGEQCDDGNTTAGDCCSATCRFDAAGAACGSASDTTCDNPDTCNATGLCLSNNEPATTVCRADAGECDVAEHCNGAGACPADAFEAAGTACGSTADTTCDNPDACNATGACLSNLEPATTICRADAGECDVAERCDGAGACPADAFEAAGTACGSTADTTCDNPDACNAAGVCLLNQEPTTTTCRASAGVCDVAERCDGAGACPGDAFAATSVACRASTGVCDVAENCTGTDAACPTDAFATATTECRAAAGACDVAETCTGTGAACPTDAFAAASTVCRTATSVCDVAETCTGAVAVCPTDAFAATTTECRAAAGDCDVAETCDGTGGCPADVLEPATTECRAAAGDCDVAEACSGSAAACPADAFEPATTECRAAAGDCDVAETCSGSAAACPADAFEPATTECRAASSACDVAETCTGTATCPPDDPGTCTDAGAGADAGARDAGSISDSGSGGEGGLADGGGGGAPPADDGGCGCVVPSSTPSGSTPWVLLLAVGVAFLVRTRRRRL